LSAGASAAAQRQQYTVTGLDCYRIGRHQAPETVTYTGTQTLAISHAGSSTHFFATVRYVATGRSGSVPSQASFAQDLLPNGELADRADLDPDYLTILNQPFAVELGAQTLREILRLRGRAPFAFPAPLAGGTLHGYLERGPIGRIGSQLVVAVKFDATGPMAGPLPNRVGIAMSGAMHMRGTAYYDIQGTLLLALNERMTIAGTFEDRAVTTPVKIVYARRIHAQNATTRR
jgi:hypothetical protein